MKHQHRSQGDQLVEIWKIQEKNWIQKQQDKKMAMFLGMVESVGRETTAEIAC